MKKNIKRSKQRITPLPILAGAVVLAAVAVLLLPKILHKDICGSSGSTALSVGSDLVIRAEEIGTEASYFDYDADGTIVQVFAVRATDGTVRLALNTCQVCNGSPYAYFVQEGDDFVCQNCGNHLALTGILLPGTGNSGNMPVASVVDGGTQYVTTTLRPNGYDDIQVAVGVPVVWTIVVDEESLNGCNNEIVIPAFGQQVKLEAGTTTITFIPEHTGSYPYSCWMGMLRNTIIVIDKEGNAI